MEKEVLDDAFVRLVQVRLRDAGHYSGKIDGEAGPGTLAALDVALPPPLVVQPREDIPAAGLARLEGVHPVLTNLAREVSARCDVPFTVIEGLRSRERQVQLVKAGASRTMSSRHLSGHAIDLWPLDAAGKAMPAGTKAAEAALWAALRKIAAVAKEVARERGIALTWGGDWGWDAPHFEINPATYPMEI